MRHDITQPKRVWVDSGKTTTWIASRRNLPKTFKSAQHPGTKLNLVWYVCILWYIHNRDLKRWRNIMEKLTFGIQMSSRNTWSNSLDHHNIISYWAHRSLVSRRLLDNDYPEVYVGIPVSSSEPTVLSARPLGEPTEEVLYLRDSWRLKCLCPTSTLFSERTTWNNRSICRNVSYRI